MLLEGLEILPTISWKF